MSGIDFLVDTNILIYIHEGRSEVEPFIYYSLAIASITEIELLGYSKITSPEEKKLRLLINDCSVIELIPEIKELAIKLKREFKLKTPDAIIAATALHLNVTIVTADKGFNKIPQLSLIEVQI